MKETKDSESIAIKSKKKNTFVRLEEGEMWYRENWPTGGEISC